MSANGIVLPNLELCMRYFEILMRKSICNCQQGTIHNHNIDAGDVEESIASKIADIIEHYGEEWTYQTTTVPGTPIVNQFEQQLDNLAWTVYYGFEDVFETTEEQARYTLANYRRIGQGLFALLDNNADRATIFYNATNIYESYLPAAERFCQELDTKIRWYGRWLDALEEVSPQMPILIKNIYRLASDVLQMEMTRAMKVGELRIILFGVCNRLFSSLD